MVSILLQSIYIYEKKTIEQLISCLWEISNPSFVKTPILTQAKGKISSVLILWSDLAGLCLNPDFLWKRDPKKA